LRDALFTGVPFGGGQVTGCGVPQRKSVAVRRGRLPSCARPRRGGCTC